MAKTKPAANPNSSTSCLNSLLFDLSPSLIRLNYSNAFPTRKHFKTTHSTTILFASRHAQREPTKNSLFPFWRHSGQRFFDQSSSSSVFIRAFEKLGINIILPQNL